MSASCSTGTSASGGRGAAAPSSCIWPGLDIRRPTAASRYPGATWRGCCRIWLAAGGLPWSESATISAHPADLLPFLGGHRLHRQAGIVHQNHVGKRGVGLDFFQRDRSRHVGDGTDVDTFPAWVIRGRIRVRERADLDDADNLLALVRVVEEAEVTELHGAHVVSRLVVAHPVPFLAGGTLRLLLLPRPIVRLRLEQPVFHVPLLHSASGRNGRFSSSSMAVSMAISPSR